MIARSPIFPFALFLLWLGIAPKLWGQGSSPLLSTPLNVQSDVQEGGNLARCNPSNGTCRTFQVIYSDQDGNFPVVNNLLLRHHGGPWELYTMSTLDTFPPTGMLYQYQMDFTPSVDACANDSSISGWEYQFDFADTLLPASGENGIVYGIPYLKCALLPTCLDSGTSFQAEIIYVQEQGRSPFTSKCWTSHDDGRNWVAHEMTQISGTASTGLILHAEVTADTPSTVISKFDFNDGKSKALGAAALFQYGVKPIVTPYRIEAAGPFLQAPMISGALYQWLYEGTPLFEQATNAIQPQLDGSYSLIITDSNACRFVCQPVFAVVNDDGGVGIILEIDIDGVGDIYPNPATNGRFIFQTDLEILSLDLIDLQGVTRRVVLMNRSGIILVPVDNLPQGVYFLRVTTAMDTYFKKVVLSR